MKKCLYCNYDNDDKAVFCCTCGHRLEETSDANTLSYHEAEDKFKPDFGYGRLKEYNTVLYGTCQQAKQMLGDMPHQAIKKVCIIVETLARDYYREAVYCKTVFSVEELYGKQSPVRITKNISEIINELDEAQLIPDTIKDVVLGITGTRNTVDYGTAEKVSQITRRTADGIYYSGEKAVDFFITAVETEPDRRFKILENSYPDLFRKAQDAKMLMDNGDLFATIDELGNLLRGLCSVLFAKYKNIENVRSTNYRDAIKLLCRYNFISSEAQDVIRDIVDNRNMHHNLQVELAYDYVKNSNILTSRLTVYLLEKISNAPLVRQKTIEFNTKVYDDIFNNMFENYRVNINAIKYLNVLQCKDICAKKHSSSNTKELNCSAGIYFFTEKALDENKTNHSFYINWDNNTIRAPYQFNCTYFYSKYPELYSFEDYMKEHYPEIHIITTDYPMAVDSFFRKIPPKQDFYKYTFDIEDLKTISTVNQTYEKYINEKKQDDERKKRMEQKLSRSVKTRKILLIVVPILVLLLVLGISYISEQNAYVLHNYHRTHSINRYNYLSVSILYAGMLVLSKMHDCLGAGRIIFGLILSIATAVPLVLWGFVSIGFFGFLALIIWDIILWALLISGHSIHY